jgi:hypothetical protein
MGNLRWTTWYSDIIDCKELRIMVRETLYSRFFGVAFSAINEYVGTSHKAVLP